MYYREYRWSAIAAWLFSFSQYALGGLITASPLLPPRAWMTITDRLPLGEKIRLSRCILWVAKVAQADANQAKPLARAEADTF